LLGFATGRKKTEKGEKKKKARYKPLKLHLLVIVIGRKKKREPREEGKRRGKGTIPNSPEKKKRGREEGEGSPLSSPQHFFLLVV